MKSCFMLLVASLLMTTSAFAAVDPEAAFLGASVILKQAQSQGFIGTHKYDDLIDEALERVADTSITLKECDAAMGTFGCLLKVKGPKAKVTFIVRIHEGEVTAAEIAP